MVYSEIDKIIHSLNPMTTLLNSPAIGLCNQNNPIISQEKKSSAVVNMLLIINTYVHLQK
jgi:hypothetical protein